MPTKVISLMNLSVHLFGIAMVVVPATSWATDQGPVQSDTVRKLLDLEAQAAVEKLEGQRDQSLGVNKISRKVDHPDRIFSIFGVGRLLTAELMLDSDYFVFRSGTKKPILGHSLDYELRSIDPPCVRLGRPDLEKTLCVQVDLP